jgi:hypothetical protein
MQVMIGCIVMLPGYAPYPRYGRVAGLIGADGVRITQMQCGDPRCAAEHGHGEVVWLIAELEAAQAYQPRASWEAGRSGAANAPVGC